MAGRRMSDGVAIWFAVGMIYFALIGRHKLVLSPEEEFAMAKGKAEYKSYQAR
jgi:ethanolamine permease